MGGYQSARADEHFRDLHGVERGALAELIAADEQVEPHALGLREVAADSSDVDGVAARRDRRHREEVLLAVVHNLDARRLGRARARSGDNGCRASG